MNASDEEVFTLNLHIKEARERAGYSQKELADLVGVAPNTFHGYESGKHDPKPGLLLLIAQACHVSADFLLGTASPDAASTGTVSDSGLRIGRLYDAADPRDRLIVETTLEPYEDKLPAEVSASPATLRFPKAKHRKDGFVEFKVYDQPAAAGLGNYIDAPDFQIEQYPAMIAPEGAEFGVRISGDSMEPEIPNGCTVFVRPTPAVDPGDIGIFVLDGQAYCKKLVADRSERKTKLRSINKEYDDIVVEDESRLRTLGKVLGCYAI